MPSMRTYRTLLLGIISAAIWPSYLALAAYAARQAPWPRGVAVVLGATLGLLALGALAANLIRWAFAPGGVAQTGLGIPTELAREARKVGVGLVVAQVVFLLPIFLLTRGLIAPDG